MCTTLTHSRPWQSTSPPPLSWNCFQKWVDQISNFYQRKSAYGQELINILSLPKLLQEIHSDTNVPTLQHLFLLAEIELVDQFVLTECDKCVFFIILKSKRSENKWWFVTFCLLFISGKLMTRYNTYFFNLWGQHLWFWLSSAYCAERRFAEVGRLDPD